MGRPAFSTGRSSVSKVKTLMSRAFEGFEAEGWTLKPESTGNWELLGEGRGLAVFTPEEVAAVAKLCGAALRHMKKGEGKAE